MPPEPLPFDRKDFFKERKPSSSDPAGVVPVRWREMPTTPSSHPNNHGSFSYRCGGAGGSSDFRRPFSGHRKQVGGGWHVTTLEPWQDKFCGSENRENNNNHSNSVALASSSHKDRNGGNSKEITASPNDNSHPHSDFVNPWDQILPKDQHDKNNGGGVGTAGGQRLDNENSLGSSIDWKPLKWTRSGSLSTRGSGFSHSSSCKNIGVDSVDVKINALPGNITPLQSPSEDGVPCLTPRTPADDANSRKKPRLGWGEGLAKYEKKKVGPDDILDKEGAARTGFADGVSSLEPLLPSPSSQLDKSPSLTGCSECASPPYSFACSSSPGVEEKASVKAAEVDNDLCNPSHHTEGSTFNLENLELTEAVNMTSLLNELLQSDETSTQASGFVRSTAMDKLQVWKADISRTLEITESEIDSLEIELKSLVSDVGASSSFPTASPPTESKDNNTKEKSGHLSLRVVSSGDMSIEKADDSVEEDTGIEDLDRESPGTATSEFVEPSTSCDNLTPSERDPFCILDIRSENTEAKCSQEDVSLSTVPVGDDAHYTRRYNFHPLIYAANKVDANESSEKLTNLLPTSQSQWCIRIPSVTNDDSMVKERFTMKKRFLKFKERVSTLKFRAFQYVWKEDLRLLSVRKFGSKSQKKFELTSRLGFADYQKHRSSIRSRFSSPAGNLSLVPTTEIIDYANKVLSDSQMKIYRNTLKVPSLMLDKSERVASRFISDNGLVEDPCKVEKERSLVSYWTSQEKEIFLENFSLFGKDFRKIASFLDHKTVADCVEFYYKNHKSERFQKTKKHPEFAKQGKSCTTNTYLVTSGKRWSRETNAAASLDLLGAASAMAANVEGGKQSQSQSQSQRKCTPKFFSGTSRDHKRVNGDNKSNSLALLCNERETAAADVLAGICGSISSEALSSCITSLVDSTDVYHQERHKQSSRHLSRHDGDDETCSDESCGGETNPSDWTDEEKSSFLQAVKSYGKDFSMISRFMRTRSRDQCKVFYSKARKCLGLDAIHFEGGKAEGGDGGNDHDHDDTCMVDSGSVISCDKSSSDVKMEAEDLHSSDSKKEEPAESDQIECRVSEAAPPQASVSGAKAESEKVKCLDLSVDPVNEMELNAVEKPCDDDNGFQASKSLFIKDSVVTYSHRKTLSQDDISSRLSFRKSGSQRCSSTDGYHLHLPKHSLMDCVESSQVLKGYPVTITTNTNLAYKYNEPQKGENLLPEHCLPRDCSLQICSSSLSQEQRSDMGKPGDVKLFGQILTKSKIIASEKANGRKSFSLKFDNNNHNNGDRSLSLSDVPMRRSYGFWDGSRIQTGFSTLPDSSSILLAKYPSAFGNSNGGNGLYSYNKNQEAFNGGVSDPVAAIRMHYAKTEQFNNGSNGGDIGSR